MRRCRQAVQPGPHSWLVAERLMGACRHAQVQLEEDQVFAGSHRCEHSPRHVGARGPEQDQFDDVGHDGYLTRQQPRRAVAGIHDEGGGKQPCGPPL
jgi:hypothetical protein